MKLAFIFIAALCLFATGVSSRKFMTMHQMAVLYKKAGGSNCATAVAIGYATSMGNIRHQSRSTMGGKDRGLWGLNSIAAHGVSTNCVFDPACAARAAVKESFNGADWSNVAAYNNGMHQPLMRQARQACAPH